LFQGLQAAVWTRHIVTQQQLEIRVPMPEAKEPEPTKVPVETA
jgi:hypothetical protein